MRQEDESPPRGSSILPAIAFVSPWMATAAMLPTAHRFTSWALLSVLVALLVAASVWSRQAAQARGVDPHAWAFMATVSFGYSMAVLLFKHGHAHVHKDVWLICTDCGRRTAERETFCYGCGAA